MALISTVGNRVISQFRGNTFIKESLGDGTTLLKVLDKTGRTIAERAKTVAREVIGDNKVITRKEARKVYQFANRNNPTDSFVWGFKNELNKVYDKKGKLLGIRSKEWRPESRTVLSGINPLKLVKNNPTYVFKGTPNEFFKHHIDGTIKRYDDVFGTVTHAADMNIEKAQMTNLGYNKTFNRHTETPLGSSSKKDYTEFFDGKPTHNEKGLPMPKRNNFNESKLDYEKMKNMSLEEMRRYWLEQTGGATHYTTQNGLDKLENVKDLVIKDLNDTSKPITDLTDFI